MNPQPPPPADGLLATDQYQLAMAQFYWRLGLHERTVQFDHFFRRYPDYGGHQAGYCINAGLQDLVEWVRDTRATAADIAALRTQQTAGGQPVFEPGFLDWLAGQGGGRGLTLRAVPEGRVVHPETPITVVEGPLAYCQILETPLLNRLNFQILVATKACRVREAGHGRPVLEFGLRRAQGGAGLLATRAALIGGADASSNVSASHRYGVVPRGTHAHSLVQVLMALGSTELEAFQAYADQCPDNCLLLLDTVNTLDSGLPNAIRVFERLRATGHRPLGVRLDSGDLAYLAVRVARELDRAGFSEAGIVLSNDLDEMLIWQVLEQICQEAPAVGLDADRVIGRLTYGVGTRLVTSWGCPALNAVYKLVGVRDAGRWIPTLKLSEAASKTPNPGPKRLWRLYDGRGLATVDLVTLDSERPDLAAEFYLHHPSDPQRTRVLTRAEVSAIEPLLVEVLADGQVTGDLPDLAAVRRQRDADLARLDPGVKRLVNPHTYHVSLSRELWELKQDLISRARQGAAAGHPPAGPATE